MSFTHGNRPEDVVTDSRGNTLSGVTNTFYATKADALARTSPLGSATTTDGVWSLTSDLPLIWARTPAGKVYPVTSAEATTADFTDQVNAAKDSAAASAAAAQNAQTAAENAATLVGAPADTVVAGLLNNPASLAAQAAASTNAAKRRDGAGTYTTGDVVEVGRYAFNKVANVGTSLVQGGAPNYENVVGGNLANVDTATSNLTGAPTLTGSNGNWNFLLGGYDTVVNGWANSVVGFHSKVDVDANHCTFGGGSRHSAAAATAYGTVGGGTQNTIAGTNPTVAGGNANQATANGATVGGGQTNIASGTGATVAGGVSNTANNANATVVGGSSNTASGNSATVVGGLTNTAGPATGATVAGGRDNVASGAYSLATGRQAVAIESGQQAHAQAAFAVAGDAQINRWVLKKQTTDATAGNLEADTGAPPVIPTDTTWAFSALVVARRTDVDGENAAWEVKGCFKRDAGNTAAFVGTPTVTSLGANAGNTWALAVASFSVGTLRLSVTGEAAKTIRWVAELRASQVSG